MDRLKKFFDLNLYFLRSASTIDDLMDEARKNQENLVELLSIRKDIAREAKRARSTFDRKFATYSDLILENLRRKGVKVTEIVVHNKVWNIYGSELEPLQNEAEDKEILFETAKDLGMVLMQRKGILVELMNRWKYNEEFESCLLRNKRFLEKFAGEFSG